MLKKIFIILSLILATFFSPVLAWDWWYYKTVGPDPVEDDYTGLKDNLEEHWKEIIWNEFVGKSNTMSWYIQKIVSYFLGIVAVIALFVLLYGFAGIFSPKSDDGFQKSLKFIKWAVIALLVIWLSWLFVMLAFYMLKEAV